MLSCSDPQNYCFSIWSRIIEGLMEEDQGKAKVQPKKRRRLVLFPVPYQGHINPMIQLAKVLHLKGFTVSIIHTKFNSPDPSKYPDFTFHSIPDGLAAHEASTSDITLLLEKLNFNCILPFRDCLANMLSDVKNKEPVTCLITDTNWYFTQDIADSFKLPRIAFRTSSICSFLSYQMLPLFREKRYLPKQGSILSILTYSFSTYNLLQF